VGGRDEKPYICQKESKADMGHGIGGPQRLYNFRYSVLPAVFARLVREGRLKEGDLYGLGEDKLAVIRRAKEIL